MSTLVKKEVYMSQQADGTLITTTTKTKTRPAAGTRFVGSDKVVVDVDWPTLSCRHCLTPPSILRILQVIVGLIVIGCVSSVLGPGPFVGVLFGQTYVLIAAAVCVCVTFAMLLAVFFSLHLTHLDFFPFKETDLIYNVVAALAYLVAGVFEVWYGSGTWQSGCSLSGASFQRRCAVVLPWAFAAAFCFLNAIFYAVCAYLTKKSRYWT